MISVYTHVLVVLEDGETSQLSRGPLQVCHELSGLLGIEGLGNGLESGSEDEGDGSEEFHDN